MTDERNCFSTACNCAWPTTESRKVTPQNIARTYRMQNASKLAHLAAAIIGYSLLGQAIQFPRSSIGFNLHIPRSRIKLGKPTAKSGKLLGRKLLNFVLDRFNFSHNQLLDQRGKYSRYTQPPSS